MEIIDGYTHCGISKYQPIERVREVMAAAVVQRAVLVQHLGEFDNSYLAQIAVADPEHFASVCLVDHAAADCGETLGRWSETGGLKGIRLTIDVFSAQAELATAAIELGLVIVLFAPRGIAGAIGPLASFLDKHPQARLVVTHLGNPNMSNLEGVAHDLLRLADYPNVYIQISGMGMFTPWPHEPLYGLIERAFERFGAARLYWGSNFPVVGDQSEYQHDLALILDHKLPLPAAAIPAIVGLNAKRLWFPVVP